MMQEGGLDCVTGLGKYQGRLIILLEIGKVLAPPDPASDVTEAKLAEKTAASGGTRIGRVTTKSASAGK